MSVAEWRDIEFPHEAETLIHDSPEEMRWEALVALAGEQDSFNAARAEQFAITAALNGHIEGLLTVADQRQDRGDKEAARRLLAHLPPPSTPEDTLRVARSHARAGAHDKARTLLTETSGAHHLDNRAAAIAGTWPHLAKPLLTS